MKISDIDKFRTDTNQYENPEEEDFQLLLTKTERDYLIAVLEEKRKTFRHALRLSDLKPTTRKRNQKILDTILSIEDKICKA